MIRSIAPPNLDREVAIDCARGLVVVGVVFNHAVDGLAGAGLVEADSLVMRVNEALYVFRMPALAFVLGLFVPRAVVTRGARSYLGERLLLMGYLYLVWFVVQITAEIAGNDVKNVTRNGESFATPWVAPSHLWFLPFVMVASIVTVVLRPWQSVLHGICALVGFGSIALMLWGWNPDVVGARGLSLVVFVAAGAWVGLDRMRKLMRGSAPAWWLAGVVSAAAFLGLVEWADPVPATVAREVTPTQAVQSAVAAMLGVVIVLAVSVGLSRGWRGGSMLLASFGHETLAVYLGHVIVVAAAREALIHVGLDDVVPILLVIVPLGVVIPYVMARICVSTPWLSWLFALPGPLRRLVVTRSPAAR